jgi:hypothetical protein
MKDFPAWMDQFRNPPQGWTPPDELKQPTSSPPVNLALSILADPAIGNDLMDVVGLWLSSLARLNMWYKNPNRRKLHEGELPQLLVLPGIGAERIYNSWRAYTHALEKASKGEFAELEYQELIAAVRDGVQAIQGVFE